MKNQASNFSEPEREELLRLLGKVLDENALNPEERDRLNELLSRFPESREIYRQHSEFAMSLDSEGRSEVHVIDGEVALHEKGGGLVRNPHDRTWCTDWR